jgi:hypothetical protein
MPKEKAAKAFSQIEEAMEEPEETMEMITPTNIVQINTIRKLNIVSDEDFTKMLAGFDTEDMNTLNKIEAEALISQLNKYKKTKVK